MDSSFQNHYTGKCKGQNPELGWGHPLKARNSVDEQLLRAAPLWFPGAISSPESSWLMTYYILVVCAKWCLMTSNASSWSAQAFLWPCSQGYPLPPIKVIFRTLFNYKNFIKVFPGSLPRELSWWVKHKPSWIPIMKRPGESECLRRDSSFPVGWHALIHLKTHTWKETADQPFSPRYYLIF